MDTTTKSRDRQRGRLSRKRQTAVPWEPTTEERQLIRAFGQMMSHAVVTVAADPQARYPAGSVAERVRPHLSKIQTGAETSVKQRASALLSQATERRRQLFGAFQDRANYWKTAPVGLDAEVKRLLKKAVYGRLDAHRREIEAELQVLVATKRLRGRWPAAAKTWVEVGSFSAEVQHGDKALTISTPQKLDFRWWTEEPGAEQGVWELVRLTSSKHELAIASGYAGKAPMSEFEIDFSKYLPAKPPSTPSKYFVRVTPGTGPKVVPTEQQGESKKVPGKAVGPSSAPVVITYSAVGPPTAQFTDIVDIYQSLRFVLESIYLVQDQMGGGAEEFHVKGFVQESFRTASDQVGEQSWSVGGYAKLAFDDDEIPDHAFLGGSYMFYLNKPGTIEWPRAYTVVLSVLEQDSGASLGEWQESMSKAAKSLLSDDFEQVVGDFLEEYFQEYVGDAAEAVVQNAPQLANLVGSIFGFVGGVVGAAVGLVLAGVISGMGDEYYGVEVFVLVLDSNLVEYIHDRAGKQTNNGYLLDTPSLVFRGSTSYPEATSWDGEVEVTFSFEFSDRQTTSI